MGNSSSNNEKLQQIERNIQEQAILIQSIENQSYGECQLMQYKQNDVYFSLQQRIFMTREDYEESDRLYQYRQNMNNCEFIVSLYDYTKTKQKQYCSKFYQIYSAWQYSPRCLLREIQSQKERKSHFSQATIFTLIHNLITALRHFKQYRITHQFIDPRSILIFENCFKITDFQFVSSNLTSYKRALIGYNENLLLSPIQLNYLKHQDKNPNFNVEKSQVFVVGLCALETASLKNVAQIYDFDHFQIDKQKLADRIEELKQGYSDQLQRLLNQLLELNDDKRPDYDQVLRLLQNEYQFKFSNNLLSHQFDTALFTGGSKRQESRIVYSGANRYIPNSQSSIQTTPYKYEYTVMNRNDQPKTTPIIKSENPVKLRSNTELPNSQFLEYINKVNENLDNNGLSTETFSPGQSEQFKEKFTQQPSIRVYSKDPTDIKLLNNKDYHEHSTKQRSNNPNIHSAFINDANNESSKAVDVTYINQFGQQLYQSPRIKSKNNQLALNNLLNGQTRLYTHSNDNFSPIRSKRPIGSPLKSLNSSGFEIPGLTGDKGKNSPNQLRDCLQKLQTKVQDIDHQIRQNELLNNHIAQSYDNPEGISSRKPPTNRNTKYEDKNSAAKNQTEKYYYNENQHILHNNSHSNNPNHSYSVHNSFNNNSYNSIVSHQPSHLVNNISSNSVNQLLHGEGYSNQPFVSTQKQNVQFNENILSNSITNNSHQRSQSSYKQGTDKQESIDYDILLSVKIQNPNRY